MLLKLTITSIILLSSISTSFGSVNNNCDNEWNEIIKSKVRGQALQFT